MSGREISSSGGDQGGEQGKTPDRDEVPDPRNSYNQYPHAESQKDREILGPTPTGKHKIAALGDAEGYPQLAYR